MLLKLVLELQASICKRWLLLPPQHLNIPHTQQVLGHWVGFPSLTCLLPFWATLDYLDSNMKLMHVAHKLLKFSSQTGEGTSWVMQSNISCLFVSKWIPVWRKKNVIIVLYPKAVILSVAYIKWKSYWREFSSLWVLLQRKYMLSGLENMLWRHYSTLVFHSFAAKEESKLSSVLPECSEPQIWEVCLWREHYINIKAK